MISGKFGIVTLLAMTALLSVPAPAAAQISGRIEILEKEGVRRKVVTEVLVYIEGAVPASGPSTQAQPQRAVTITSKEKSFTPRVEVVEIGSSVDFPNVDDIMHNVFSITKGNRFDLGLYKSGAQKSFSFENPGLVRIYCNIHPQMSAFIHVVESPFFAWAEPDGSFRIEGVPAGSYTLKVWSEQGEVDRPIVVTEQGASGLLVELDVSKYKKRPHLNKFGKPYKRKRGKY